MICEHQSEFGHIALTCRNHTDQRWSTKNIGGRNKDGSILMGRHLFYGGDDPRTECKCPGSDLRVVCEKCNHVSV